MDNIIYKAKPYYGMWISVPFLLYCIISLLFILYLIITWKKSSVSGRFIGCFIAIFLIFTIFSQFYSAFESRQKVYNNYIKGNYKTIEGYISDYQTEYDLSGNTKYDSFCVSNIWFHTPGFASCWGYPLTKATGSQLDNGVKVKIHYIPYKYENVIMYLEILERKTVDG